MSIELSEEQKMKLQKLDQEMYEKKKKQEQTASSTGIPEDVVGLDVVKIGIMLGLIKNKELFENNIKTKSLLQMLMGEDTELPKATCPPGYYKALVTITEKEKIEYQQNYVHVQSNFFVEFREQVVKRELANINKHVDIKFHNETVENFKTECLELLDVFIEDLVETPDDENVWKTITIITNSLLGVLTIGEYKKLVTSNIQKIHQNLPSYEFKIMTHLSTVDRLLSLFNGVLRKCKDYPFQTNQEIQQRFCNELEIRNFTKNPQLQPFVFNDIVKEVCVPSIMYLPIEWIFQKCMLGPYRNNSIGFLHTPGQGDFYILASINSDGGRTWAIDQSLQNFIKNIVIATVEYIIKMFRTLYFECFQTNHIIKQHVNKKKKKSQRVDSPVIICLTKNCLQEQVFKMLLRNLQFLSDFHNFRHLLFAIIKQTSPIIPTENDFFNYIKSFYDLRQPNLPVYHDTKTIFQHHLHEIFDDYNPSLYVQVTQFIKNI
jgi:hypothetical protein